MISKKASIAAIRFVNDKYGRKLKVNSSWAEVFQIIMVGYYYNVYTMHEGTTKVQVGIQPGEGLGSKDEIIQEFFIPNSEVFNERDHDWDWNYIYKTIIEWMMKKKKRVKKVKFNTKQIESRLNELRELIKTSKGSAKRKAVKEYNDLSKALAG